MSKATIKDKMFKTFTPEADILERAKAVTGQIDTNLAGKEPLFLAVLDGSFVFVADLTRYITIPNKISFVKLASYQGIVSTDVIKEVIGLNEDITNRYVVIVEDIADTGVTICRMIETLGMRDPTSIDICTLLLKPGKLSAPPDIKYVAMEIPNDLIVGYGLDYEQQGRNLRDIYALAGE